MLISYRNSPIKSSENLSSFAYDFSHNFCFNALNHSNSSSNSTPFCWLSSSQPLVVVSFQTKEELPFHFWPAVSDSTILLWTCVKIQGLIYLIICIASTLSEWYSSRFKWKQVIIVANNAWFCWFHSFFAHCVVYFWCTL